MENKTCQYEGCNELVNSPHDDSLCVFHAPKEKKGITGKEFNELIRQRFDRKHFNYIGFVFPGDVAFYDDIHNEPWSFQYAADFSNAKFLGAANFRKARFLKDAKFRGAQFEGDADFSDSSFSGIADFNNADFLEGTNFQDARFDSIARFLGARLKKDSFFSNARFTDRVYYAKTRFENAFFKGAVFSKYSKFNEIQVAGIADFGLCRFEELADFREARFSGLTTFDAASFTGGIDFSNTRFSGGANFCNTHFDRNVLFESNHIGGTLRFEEILLGDMTRLYFNAPRVESTVRVRAQVWPLIIFLKVLFRPFYTYFEKIGSVNEDDMSTTTILIFRYCELKDVYFTNNDMSIFSFYKSSFDQARFVSCRWGTPEDSILPEETFIEGIHSYENDDRYENDVKSKYMIEDLSGYEEIASLYRRMKTALDYTKDYQQAGRFYFREFEMKRRALNHEIKNNKGKFTRFRKRVFGRCFLYSCYKIFAGYGEKPLWSFLWLWIWTVIFALGHMVFGLEYFEGGVVFTKYDFFGFLNDFSVGNFIKEFGRAFGYALSQAIPKNYIPYKISDLNPTNPFGIAWSILNTIVLWILIIFIAIGLKRHFRRF